MTERRTGRLLLLGTAAAAGLALYFARGKAGDDTAITYPPLDTPKPLGPDLWIVDSGPFSAMGMKLPIRMTVIRLADGGLLLHSPTRYTPELARALAAIGPIRHLVASTMAHWTFLQEWQRACPDATTWGVPVLRTRPQVQRSGVRIDRDLGSSAPPEWAGDVEQGLVRGGGGFEEAWFFHKASRTLVLTDLVENLDPEKLGPVTAVLMRGMRATSATTGLQVRPALAAKKAEVRAAMDTMIALQPETVLFAHGDIFRGNGTEQLRQAFAWLA
ncbi:DUF4336 domain-containing protein [Sphingomonas jeddahensis]|uniref:DUF4336 domain-containing protein n=1 Tax=Sphingomonas jeddahensis TaxID=1915074 RepID=A0A1V2ERR0_9SPHN|nr:DUF4336 domain-containing protein [Sphingomonas jeddahensis]ONF95361.1 hypothetical protein SPHI_24530 [Sphingomonas jeddahensis]